MRNGKLKIKGKERRERRKSESQRKEARVEDSDAWTRWSWFVTKHFFKKIRKKTEFQLSNSFFSNQKMKGKTMTTLRFVQDNFSGEYDPTIEV